MYDCENKQRQSVRYPIFAPIFYSDKCVVHKSIRNKCSEFYINKNGKHILQSVDARFNERNGNDFSTILILPRKSSVDPRFFSSITRIQTDPAAILATRYLTKHATTTTVQLSPDTPSTNNTILPLSAKILFGTPIRPISIGY